MFLTEEEARQKICMFDRTNSNPDFVKVECVASECMAWCWATEFKEVSTEYFNEKGELRQLVKRKGVTSDKGYCGLINHAMCYI